MELTITQVTRMYNVTPRMLRYYEKKGLLHPIRNADNAYRSYDEDTVRRLRLIILLRKLRISLKQIEVILQDNDQLQTLQILKENISELDGEIKSLNTVRSVINEFAARIEENIGRKVRTDFLSNSDLMEAANAIAFSETTFDKTAFNESTNPKKSDSMCSGQNEMKGTVISMAELNNATETNTKNLNVRIVQLPPFTVASYHYIGQDPEEKVGDVMSEFVQKSRLYEIKPDSRMFGFNRPNPGVLEDGTHGYEDWVTIPDDMEVPAPFTKKHFDGGLFAVMAIPFPEFQLWGELINWVNNNSLYEADYSEEELSGQRGGFEEHYNWVWAAHNKWEVEDNSGQGISGIDLYVPVKLRKK